jgi:hypothetical protein
MSITPIEIATMAPKSQEVSIHKVQESQKPMNDQALLSKQFNNEIMHNNSQTVKTIKSDNKEYRYDAKEKGNNSFTNSNPQKKKKDDSKDKEAVPKDNFRSGSIDIKI